jgi:alkanesulfonate monooxygenase
LISGSSEAGMAAAHAIGATAVRYPAPASEENDESAAGVPVGIRIGVIARDTTEEAWAVALRRFPEDRKGQITHALAMGVSDSAWHRQLSELAKSEVTELNPYWLGPFKNYKTFCPYLVGSYEQVGRELARYRARGFRTFILDIPPSREEFDHTSKAFASAEAAVKVVP